MKEKINEEANSHQMMNTANRENYQDLNILQDLFKVALNIVPSNFSSMNVGQMKHLCLCGAKHFANEKTLSNQDEFTMCCRFFRTPIYFPSSFPFWSTR